MSEFIAGEKFKIVKDIEWDNITIGKTYTALTSERVTNFIDDNGNEDVISYGRVENKEIEIIQQYTLEYEETTFGELQVGELFWIGIPTNRWMKVNATEALGLGVGYTPSRDKNLVVHKVKGINVMDTLKGIFDKYSGE